MIAFSDIEVQIPLIHIVESDDLYLEAQQDVFGFDLLRDLDGLSLRPVAARYYEGLWQFNEQQARARAERPATAATTRRSLSSRHLVVKTGLLFAGRARHARNATAAARERDA